MDDVLPFESDAVIPPSSLLVFWPGDEPPMAEEIRLRLEEWGQPAVTSDGAAPEETLWSFWLDLAHRPMSFLIWCEPTSPSRLVRYAKGRWRSPDQEAATHGCRWIVGVEGPISLRQPAADYQLQLRLCDAVSRDWAPAVYDANALRFWTTEDIRQLIDTRTPPRTACLYTVHKLPTRSRVGAERCYWVHTHGLERAGVPDMEIFDVPHSLLPAAAELIEAVGDLWIEFQTPEPQTPFPIGRGMEICWRPWQAVVVEMSAGAVGGSRFRRQELGHAGYRAVLVGQESAAGGGLVPRWNAPLNVIRMLTQSESTLYKTSSETERMARMARERWGVFGILFAGRRPPGWRFAVKLRFRPMGEVRTDEHLWFEVEDLQPGRIRATALSLPAGPLGVLFSNTDWHDLDRLSDWRIITNEGTFGPEEAGSLLEEVSSGCA